MESTFAKLRPFLAVSAVMACMSLLGACTRSDISERPPVDKGAAATPMETQASTIGALIALPLDEAIQAANAALPRTYTQDWTNGEDACADLGALGKHCVGTKYKYRVSRGEIAISPSGQNAVKFSVDVSVDGQGGFRGDGADLLDLDAKNFDAAAKVDIVLTPTIGQDWCPAIQVAPSYNWTKSPRVEIVSRVNVDVSGRVDNAIRDRLPQIVQAVERSMDCAQFKSQLAAVYGKRSFPVQVPSGNKLHVNVEPIDFAFSGFNIDAQAIRLAAMLTAKVELSAAPVTPSPLPLPPLKTIGVSAPPRIAFAVPLRVPFTMLQTEAGKLVGGKTFEADSPAGKVQATVDKVEIYPTSNGRIAIGIDFDAKLPGRVLDTKGSVFIISTPVTEGRTVVRLKDPSFTRILDSEVWNALSALFDAQIRRELDKNLRYDLAGDLDKARRALTEKLADPAAIPNARAIATDVDIGIGRVAVNGTDLVAEAVFGASLTLEPRLEGLVARQ